MSPAADPALGDRRRLAFDGTTALDSLRDHIAAARFVPGRPASIQAPETPLLRQPGGGMDKALLWGEPVVVISEAGPLAFVQSDWDAYVGYVDRSVLAPPIAASHRITARASHLYEAPDFKAPVRRFLSMGSALEVTGQQGRFLATTQGFVPQEHAHPMDHSQPLAETALRLLGTPYLWGGNSGSGIDCSGLVQLACYLAGIDCPRDSDQQAAELGTALPLDAPLQAGDVICWRGHVGMMRDPVHLVHANAHHMAVAVEPLATALDRIGAREFGAVTGIRRPA